LDGLVVDIEGVRVGFGNQHDVCFTWMSAAWDDSRELRTGMSWSSRRRSGESERRQYRRRPRAHDLGDRGVGDRAAGAIVGATGWQFVFSSAGEVWSVKVNY
jgi:hypothetical protein